MFGSNKYKNGSHTFPARQAHSKQIFFPHVNLGQHCSKTWYFIFLHLFYYLPSTHEGLFLVVPATFPGRQEHLTVCDRSSIRFLLQHLWAAITSHVPPSDKEKRQQTTNYIKSASQPWSDTATFCFLNTSFYRHLWINIDCYHSWKRSNHIHSGCI